MKIRKDYIMVELEDEDEIGPKTFWMALGQSRYFPETDWGKTKKQINPNNLIVHYYQILRIDNE